MSDGICKLELFKHRMTDRNIIVSTDGNEANAVALSFSNIEVEPAQGNYRLVNVTMPEKMAIESGLMKKPDAESTAGAL